MEITVTCIYDDSSCVRYFVAMTGGSGGTGGGMMQLVV